MQLALVIVCVEEICKMSFKVRMTVVVMLFNCGAIYGAVHLINLIVVPIVIDIC